MGWQDNPNQAPLGEWVECVFRSRPDVTTAYRTVHCGWLHAKGPHGPRGGHFRIEPPARWRARKAHSTSTHAR